MRYLYAILFVFSLHVQAEPTNLWFGGVSYHTVSKDTDTWFHRAIILQKGDYIGGYLKNSYGQDSFVLGYEVFEKTIGKSHLEIHMTAIRGYDKCFGENKKSNHKVLACALPIFTFSMNTDTTIKPQVTLWGDAVVFTGKYPF